MFHDLRVFSRDMERFPAGVGARLHPPGARLINEQLSKSHRCANVRAAMLIKTNRFPVPFRRLRDKRHKGV